MQQREEKQLETSLDSIISRVNDLKSSIAAMIFKVENEYETLNWPNFLDNFALLSGHVSVFSSFINAILDAKNSKNNKYLLLRTVDYNKYTVERRISHSRTPVLWGIIFCSVVMLYVYG